ncbi:hypothetical protein [Flavobacterium piscinae]|nr:hypothetical protein [Flavobacterium piscinae]
MLTGQNAFLFTEEIEISKGIELLHLATSEIKATLKQEGKKYI